jgi:Zn-dependent M28 family amino/carboxypeptidase
MIDLIITTFFIFFSLITYPKNHYRKDMNNEQIKERLYKDVEFLTTVKPARNYGNLNSLNKVADYIRKSFTTASLKTEVQKFTVDGNEYKNIIATVGPVNGPRIIVGAHYDVAGNQDGADDNASAVAGLLEMARMLSQKKHQLKYRIDLVAYSLEEPPYFATENMGSAIHAKYMRDNKIEVKAMVCLEMIGYFSDKPNSQNFPDPALKKIYPSTGNFIIVVGKEGQETITNKVKGLMKQNSSIDVQSINLPAENPLAGLSDHRNYWVNQYDAVMINDTSFLRNPNYHQSTDTIHTLDFDKMSDVVKGVAGVCLILD